MKFADVNWLSIVLAAAGAWIFGAVYYTALGRQWIAAQGKTMEQCQAEMAAKSPVQKYAPFVIVLIAEIIMAWVLYGILLHLNAFSVRGGLMSAGFVWFGFVLTTVTANNAFGGRRPMLTVIDCGGWLGAMLIIGAVVGGMGR